MLPLHFVMTRLNMSLAMVHKEQLCFLCSICQTVQAGKGNYREHVHLRFLA